MRLSRNEILFVALGAILGAVVALAVKAGLVAQGGSFPPFVIVLFGLGIAEILFGFISGQPLGTLVRMPARFIAFVVGVCVSVIMLGGKLV